MTIYPTRDNKKIDHFRITFSLFLKASLGAHLSYENEFNLHVKEISFSYERMSIKTHFEEEAKGNLEMAYSKSTVTIIHELYMKCVE